MKVAAVIAFLLPAAMAAPAPAAGGEGIVKRQVAETDLLVFSYSMSTFQSRRAARNPASLDWSSDNCSWSPDNPLGFPFEPGCQRHDFGYRNFKAQSRFSDANKLRIDDNFLNDLRNLCVGQSFESACRGLANVYYAAVRAFGRSRDHSRFDSGEAVAAYEAAVAAYNAEVEKSGAEGGKIEA